MTTKIHSAPGLLPSSQAAQGLLLFSENFQIGTPDNSTTTDAIYTYADNGNRLTRSTGGALSNYAYDSGSRLVQVQPSGQPLRTYNYDAGGNLASSSVQASTMTYTMDHRLKTVANGVGTTTYHYDPERRRVRAVRASQDRRFVVGPGSGTDLELIHLITDAASNVKAVYIYAGAQPLARFSVDGNGEVLADTVRFYEEDASGTILRLRKRPESAANEARFRYDAFGNMRAGYNDPASASHFPTGVLGDFRYHGAWLESETRFYHMRARDYEPDTGRFLERDPYEGDVPPESLHPYSFANGNPYYYSDPSGEFTIIEMNFSGAMQGGLQGLKAAAVTRARRKAFEVISGVVKKQVVNEVKSLLPVDNLLAGF